MANTLAYYNTATILALKSFIAQAPGVVGILSHQYLDDMQGVEWQSEEQWCMSWCQLLDLDEKSRQGQSPKSMCLKVKYDNIGPSVVWPKVALSIERSESGNRIICLDGVF